MLFTFIKYFMNNFIETNNDLIISVLLFEQKFEITCSVKIIPNLMLILLIRN